MTKQLIDGLRTAADWIESGKVEYFWGSPESCNCGILAQAILRVTPTEIQDTCEHGNWYEEVNRCHQTGIPINHIVKALIDVGMKSTDFVNLEYLIFEGVKPEISKLHYYHYTNAKNVISYMRTWADSLERKLLNQSTKTKTKTTTKVTVSC
jgi:hypothetical protein